MKTLSAKLTIAGFGYLSAISEIDGETVIRIEVLPTSNEPDREFLWVKALVGDDIKPTILACHEALQKDDIVMFGFVAEYIGFSNIHYGQYSDDPRYMLTIKARLCHLEGICINGVPQ